MRSPCQDCERRCLKCHDSCADYQMYKTRLTEINTERIKYLGAFIQTDKRLQQRSKSMKKFYKRNAGTKY